MPKAEDAAAKQAREQAVIKIYKMMNPRPKELLLTPRRYILGGAVQTYNVKEKRRKPRVLFLFNDTLMIGKREGRCKYWLKTLVRLTPTMRLENMKVAKGPQVEFRLVTHKRVLVFFAQTEGLKQLWLKHISMALQGKYDLDYEPPQKSDAAKDGAVAGETAAAVAAADAVDAAGEEAAAAAAATAAGETVEVVDDSADSADPQNAQNAQNAADADSADGSVAQEVTAQAGDAGGDVGADRVIMVETKVFSFGEAVEEDGMDLDIAGILSDLGSLTLGGYSMD